MVQFLVKPTIADILEEPIRGTLYGTQQLEEYAIFLARNLEVDDLGRPSVALLKRLNKNHEKLIGVYHYLVSELRKNESVAPAAEWVVDNFHIIEEQIREIKRDLPTSYYKELPKICEGDLTGFPRIYAVALALVAHSDSLLNLDVIQRFADSFQTEKYLSIAELWAFPITLRLALVENARRISARLIWDQRQRNDADLVADEIINSVMEPTRLAIALQKISKHCGEQVELHFAFVAQLAKRLRDQEAEVWPATEFLLARLKALNYTVEQAMNLDHQHQAANQVTIANVISSMRLLSNTNWQALFEKMSLIDRELGQDPSGDYWQMDFATRDQYRHVIERIGKRTRAPELAIAQKVVDLAKREKKHVGWFLIGGQVEEVERDFKYFLSYREIFTRSIRKFPSFSYFGLVLFFLVDFYFLFFLFLRNYHPSLGLIVFISLLLLVPCSEVAINLTNYFYTHLVKPKKLPKFDITQGVPKEARTLVVIPCLLVDMETLQELVNRLEVHYLGNADPEVYFSLATDFCDAITEVTTHDDALVETAVLLLEALNKKYDMEGDEHFLLFHRKRIWNSQDCIWMGWERKRGKLEELNSLIKGEKSTSYDVVTCNQKILRTFKYVITLDADTQLGRDNAKKLIGTALHPLNRPKVDEKKRIVVSGYGIIQPRISISLESSSRSIFAMIFSGNTGIDPYTTALSDIYQDLFGEGSFTGKGLYDVEAFQKCLSARAPENTILSHDLFEGLFVRTALATDIEFLDDYPKSYFSFFLRQHRWVRGDWQIAPWILRYVPDSSGNFYRNQLSFLSKWKIADNLRRSLVAFSTFLLLVGGVFFLPGSPFFWAGVGMIVIGTPCFLHIPSGIFISPRGVPWTSNFWSEVGKTRLNFAQFFISISFLLHQTLIQIDAILRSFYRTFISRKDCLEWNASAQVDKESQRRVKPFWQTTWPVKLVVLTLFFAVLTSWSLQKIIVLVPFLILWVSYSLIAEMTTAGGHIQRPELKGPDQKMLRDVARRIWHFFETFVNENENWLPPDNVQQDPEEVIAHRTSPTNIGLYAMSILSSWDLGYLGSREILKRLEQMLSSMQRLEKFQGHFLNWYDTRTLEPLAPKYISTVDSGNLAGYLLVVKEALSEIAVSDIIRPCSLIGLGTTLDIIEKEVLLLKKQMKQTSSMNTGLLMTYIVECRGALRSLTSDQISDWYDCFRFLKQSLEGLEDSLTALEREYGAHHYRILKGWVESILFFLRGSESDLEFFAPWLKLPLEKMNLAGSGLNDLLIEIKTHKTISELSDFYRRWVTEIESLQGKIGLSSPDQNIRILKEALALGLENIQLIEMQSRKVGNEIENIFRSINFNFLIDKQREVFAIGYNINDGAFDEGFYDLLASEARLASFIAIAKGDAPVKHWFRLGRQLVPVDGRRALLSWSASMFEYLMPILVMKNYESTLLHETMDTIVKRQITFGNRMHVPWGVSESGYNARDLNFNYQYGPFGIPGLGLKRGLGQDLVVSPYATFLAAQIKPLEAVANLRELEKKDLLACYGFYEAIDYTPARLLKDQKFAVIRSFMAHHQGMSIVAIDNVLNKNIMQERFHSEIRVRSTQMLLQERVPNRVSLTTPKVAEIEWQGIGHNLLKSFTRVYENPNQSTPRLQVLSNGKYSVVLTTAGSGFSFCDGVAVTRWREDSTRDCWGSYILIKDTAANKTWSTSYQPRYKEPDTYRVNMAEDKVEFLREDGFLRTYTQILISPEDNVEMRNVGITNTSDAEIEVVVTSYMEPVIGSAADDLAHPAFNNLFLQTEYLPARRSLIARRRPRVAEAKEAWGVHSIALDRWSDEKVEYETDRSKFIGRGRSLDNPIAMDTQMALSNSTGSTLEPVLALRVRLRIQPGETRHILFNTGLAESREEALHICDRYHDIRVFERESKMAWTKARIDLRHLGMDSESTYLFQRLAERIIYVDPSLRQASQFLAQNTRDQKSLWPYGISGDLPIVSVIVRDKRDLVMLRRLARGYEYLRMKGIIYDFVILAESKDSYYQELQEDILLQIRSIGLGSLLNKRGGVFIFQLDRMPEQDRGLMQAIARVSLSSDRGSLKDQIVRRPINEKYSENFIPKAGEKKIKPVPFRSPQLEYFNGLGGFSPDGKEYVIILRDGQWTPAPWINVVANENNFGFQVSELGAGFTWSLNSRENRLTPWSNDPVGDPPGEIIYVRDEESGAIWSPTPAPIRQDSPYVIRHGQGYSIFESTTHGLAHTLRIFVPKKESVKIYHLKIKNISGAKRFLSVYGYVEWVLGTHRATSAPFIVTERDESNEGLYATNPFIQEFADRVSFFYVNGQKRSFTCDRKEFLGRNGNYSEPQALKRESLSSRCGVGLDPCGALQTRIEIDDKGECDVIFLIGQGASRKEAREMILQYQSVETIELAFLEICQMWDAMLGKIQIKTPEPTVDLLMNRWLLYQTIVCRFWARSAFYQSGGAFGFRDQLQDSMAIVYVAPELARQHILRAAGRQFLEGDVQHWWHPPSGRGVRTRFVDDLLWLPFVVAHYVRVTGDREILKEKAFFIEAPVLGPGQEDSYTEPISSGIECSILNHCQRALDASLKTGVHGLPLIGSGDWNDGLNRVGEGGQGESVWMGWFLYKVLAEFLPFCDAERKKMFLEKMEQLKKAVEENAWDGSWYRRAYFDDGTPIGSSSNEECQIDSLAQSWSVISGAGTPQRQLQSMGEVAKRLIKWDHDLILLLAPPFDNIEKNPGYIKGYVPGVRENGGQYTHAAIWVLMAFAELGDNEIVLRLFRMLNPIHHTKNWAGIHKYKLEPYVVAADVYAIEPHTGRGGWSWYTGSAAWMYRAGLESLLGFSIEGKKIRFKPCIPKDWFHFELTYFYKSTAHIFRIENRTSANPFETLVFEKDKLLSTSGEIELLDKGGSREILVVFCADKSKGALPSQSVVL